MQTHEGLVPGEPQAVAMLEAAYRIDRPEVEWVEGLRQVFESSARGAETVQAFVYDASDVHRLQMRSLRGGTPGQRQWIETAIERAQGQGQVVQQGFFGPSAVMTPEGVYSTNALEQIFAIFANDWGIVDSWLLRGGDLRQRGVMLGAMSRRPIQGLSPSLGRCWDAVAAHLSAAFCLREAMAAGMAPAEGVFAADGRVLDAQGDARSLDARESLRHAVRAIDRARTRHRRHSPEALAAWQAVVAGRWTLVDQTESDGKRVLLARVNELPVRAEARLSGREAQALGLAAQGLSNKQIGYRLGVGAPAVTNYLKRAAQKLGVSSRAGLLRQARGQGAGGPAQG